MRTTEVFWKWLEANPAPWRLGEIIISQPWKDAFSLRHREDVGASDLMISTDPLASRQWVKLSREGTYRPLKGEGNLSRGWCLHGLGFSQLCEALNIFYPTAVANAFAQREGKLPITSFGETAERQTGMYHIVRKTTADQLSTVISELCEARCLKTRLWSGRVEVTWKALELPLLCPEACNLFISDCRKVIRGGSEE